MNMSRPAKILAALEAARSVSVEDLAATLNVGRRTIVNELAGLQEHLGSAASLEVSHGRYRLLIAYPEQYRAAKLKLSAGDTSFNDPTVRARHIIARLYRALVPLRTEELAHQMAVGRTTVVADLVRVRRMVSEANLTVEGRPNVGLTLEGPELQQRLFVLRHLFPVAYPDSDAEGRIARVVDDAVRKAGLHHGSAPEITRWATVTLDRAPSERRIEYLPSRYAGIPGTEAHAFATSLAQLLSTEFGVEVGENEIIFLALPVAAIRTPSHEASDLLNAENMEAETLVSRVLSAVRSEMEINLEGREFLEEFARHLSYMVNRMRYRIWVDDSGIANIGEEFPVAHRMATLAARVIEGQVGLPLDSTEVGFLAAYFQVFLEAPQAQTSSFLRVVVVANTGRVAAELVRRQLAKILPTSTSLRVLPLEEATIEGLAGVDLVVITGDVEIQCDAPVLHVTRVLDRASMERQLERLQLRLHLPRSTGREGSVLAGALDEAHFFALPSGTAYPEAVDFITGHLEGRGLVEAGFGERIRQREARALMQLDPWVGFPHAALEHQSSVVLAIGVVPRDIAEDGVRLIVLLGTPSDPGRSEEVLVQVYDEVLRLGARRDLLDQLCRLTTFEDFYYFMENNPSTER